MKVSLWAHCQLNCFHIQFLTRAVSRKYSKICLTKFRNIGWKGKLTEWNQLVFFWSIISATVRKTISGHAMSHLLNRKLFVSTFAKFLPQRWSNVVLGIWLSVISQHSKEFHLSCVTCERAGWGRECYWQEWWDLDLDLVRPGGLGREELVIGKGWPSAGEPAGWSYCYPG